MGFGSFFHHLVKIKPKSILKTAINPLRVVPGLKHVNPLGKYLDQFASNFAHKPLQVGFDVAAAYYTKNPTLVLSDLSPPPQAQSYSDYNYAPPNYGGQPMALNFGNLLGSVSQIFGGNQNPYFQSVSNVASFAQPFASALTPARTMRPAPVKPGQVVVLPRSGLTQEIATAAQKLLARLGIRYPLTTGGLTGALRRALGPIATLARRTPGGTIVSILIGLGLTAYEANLLTAWQTQHRRGRRMNPANAKALRRAARRIRSFHKLCTHTDLLRSHGRRASRYVSAGPRCGTCRKSPCRC